MKSIITGLAVMTLLTGTGYAIERPIGGSENPSYHVIQLQTSEGKTVNTIVSNEEFEKLKKHDTSKGNTINFLKSPPW